VGVAEYFEWKMEAIGHLKLVFSRLSAKAEDSRFSLHEFLMEISETTSLWSAAASAGNHIPPIGQWLSWYAGHGITEDNRCGRAQFREIDFSISS
jgi:hypothetical protein